MDKKTCSICNITKQISDFYSSGKWCRECSRAHNRNYYIKNRERILVQMKAYADSNREKHRANSRSYHHENRNRLILQMRKNYWENREERIKKLRELYQKNGRKYKDQKRQYYLKNRDKVLARNKSWQQRNPGNSAKKRAHYKIQRSAHGKVNYAIKIGKLIRKPCQSCGDKKSFAHHEDYSKPLDVKWLCPACHNAHHANVISLKFL